MTAHSPLALTTRLLALACALLISGCGMKGPLRHPDPPAPPPVDAKLAAPPTVTPAPAPDAAPTQRP
ncbi:hypothetical protein CDEF62S_05408 [Castellaniella defragrans]